MIRLEVKRFFLFFFGSKHPNCFMMNINVLISKSIWMTATTVTISNMVGAHGIFYIVYFSPGFFWYSRFYYALNKAS